MKTFTDLIELQNWIQTTPALDLRQICQKNAGLFGVTAGEAAKWTQKTQCADKIVEQFERRGQYITLEMPDNILHRQQTQNTIEFSGPQAQTTQKAPEAPQTATDPEARLLEALRELTAQNKAQNLDETRIREIIKEETAPQIKQLEIVIKKDMDQIKTALGVCHKEQENVIKMIASGVNTMLTGPKGTGKSTLARKAAEALDLVFYPMSISLFTDTADFYGYMDANGNYIPTQLRKAFETGGVLLLDEFDRGNPAIGTVLNLPLDNRIANFPDCGTLEAHPDFRVVACTNTHGRGPDEEYNGCLKQDGSILSRFATRFIDIDEELEDAICPNKKWLERVRKYRRAAELFRIKDLNVSPRAARDGAKLIEIGFPVDEVEHMVIFKGLPTEQIKKLQNAA